MTDKPNKRVKIIPFCSIPSNKSINRQLVLFVVLILLSHNRFSSRFQSKINVFIFCCKRELNDTNLKPIRKRFLLMSPCPLFQNWLHIVFPKYLTISTTFHAVKAPILCLTASFSKLFAISFSLLINLVIILACNTVVSFLHFSFLSFRPLTFRK